MRLRSCSCDAINCREKASWASLARCSLIMRLRKTRTRIVTNDKETSATKTGLRQNGGMTVTVSFAPTSFQTASELEAMTRKTYAPPGRGGKKATRRVAAAAPPPARPSGLYLESHFPRLVKLHPPERVSWVVV